VAGSVKLRVGNLFEGPTDLVVLPCSTAGTIIGFVARSLADYSIPHPRVGMALGEVEFLPFEGAENIAQFVGFAAKVKSHDSSLLAIQEIATAVGKFTQELSEVKAVAAPLLGAGEGG
jgi:hypothetical protein